MRNYKKQRTRGQQMENQIQKSKITLRAVVKLNVALYNKNVPSNDQVIRTDYQVIFSGLPGHPYGVGHPVQAAASHP